MLALNAISKLYLNNNCRYLGAGAAYGTAKAGIGIAGVGTFRPDLIMKVFHLVQHGQTIQMT